MLAFNTSEQTQESINKVAVATPNTAANYWSFTESPKKFTYTRTSTANSSKFTFYTHSSDGSVGVKLPPNMTIGNIESLSSNFTVVNTNPGDTQNPDNVVIFFSIYTKPKGDGTDRASWYNSRIAITPKINTDNNGHRIISGVSYTITPDHFGAAGTLLSTSFSSSDLVNFILMSSNSIEPLINWRFSLDNVFVAHNIPPPIISSLDKYFGNAGDTLTITGSRLTGMTNVMFNTSSVSVTPDSDTQASVIIPDIEGNAINIQIKNYYLTSNTVTFTYLPVITSFNSSFGIENTLLTINGKHLTDITNLVFDSTLVSANKISDTQATGLIPFLPKSNVSVAAKNSVGLSNFQDFTYYPVVTSFNSYGNPGDTLTITGSHLTSTTMILFNNTYVNASTISDSQVTTIVPDLSDINLSVKAINSNTSSNIQVFTYLPVITSTNLSAIVNTNVSVYGKKFIPSSYVSFGSTNVTPLTVTEDILYVTVPTGTRTTNIKVINPYGESNAAPFTYLPNITSINPTSGTTKNPVIVSGTNLINTSFVSFGDVSTNNITDLTDDSFTVYTPANSGNVPIYVTDISNATIVSPTQFNYLNPEVTYINPTSGTKNTIITVTGQNLGNTSFASFGNISTNVSNLTSTSFNIITPQGTGIVPLSITNNMDTVLNVTNFTYLNPSVFTNTSFGRENTTVTITGENLINTSFVLFDTTTTTFTNTDIQIIATIPYSLENNASISIINNLGTSLACPNHFTYLPNISSLSIINGIPNNTITITGNHLSTITSLLFGTTSASYTINSNSEISAIVPDGLSGSTVNVVAQNLLGNSNGLIFNYYNYPTITSITPTTGIEKSNMTITGTYLSNVSNVLFGTTNASFKIVDSSIINASIPPGINGNVSIQVSGINGSSNYQTFTYNYQTPSISSVYNSTKNNSSSGIPGNQLVIYGNNLTGTKPYFNDIEADYTYISDTVTQLTFPYGVLTGNVTINVSGPGGKSNNILYTCEQQTSVITSFSKTNGIPGDEIMLIGNYLYGTNQIIIDDKNASFTPISETNVSFILPLLPPGGYKIYLSNSKEPKHTILNYFVYNFQTPEITSLINSNGIGGQTMLINGTNFYSVDNVFFGNTTFYSYKPPVYQYISDKQLSLIIPDRLPGNVNVSLNAPAGYSNIKTFTYNHQLPLITSTNLNGITGDSLTIVGKNFTNAAVLFGTTNVIINSITDTQVNVSVPQGMPGNVSLFVAGPAGTATTYFLYNYQPPIIDSISPINGNPGDSVSITGKNLYGVSLIKFLNSLTNIEYVNDTLINVSVPPNLPSTVNLTVYGPAGESSKPFTYNYRKPIISSFNTISPYNISSGIGGNLLTINGANFTNVSVLFGNTLSTINSIRDTRIVVTVPPGLPGIVNVNVCGPNTSTQTPFTYNYQLPVISSLSNISGIGGDTIEVNGRNFTNASILFNNKTTSYNVVSDTQINVSVPSGLPGTVYVNVSGPAGYALSPFTYNYQRPNIQLEKSNGVEGEIIKIIGTNLFGTNTVLFGNTIVSSQNVSDTQVNVTVPQGLPGQVNVLLRSPGGDSNIVPFTYNYREPIISYFNTNNGIPGAPLTINGINFSNLYNLNNVSVFINSTPATVTRFTDTSISVTLPDNLPGINPVIVETPGGTSNPLNFRYDYEPPTLSLITTSGVEGDTVILEGDNLLGTIRVFFGKDLTSFIVKNNNLINASVPKGLPGQVAITSRGPAGTSPPVYFTYNYKTPNISGLNVTNGLENYYITIYGTNLFGTTSVLFGSINARIVGVNDNEVTVYTPNNLPGVYNVRLTTPSGDSNTVNFTYNYKTPIITSLNKSSGLPGDSVIIEGKNLFNSTVSLNSTSAVVQSNTDTQITITLPDINPGKYVLTILSQGGRSNGMTFTYNYQTPIIASLDTKTGIPGNNVIIYGTHLLGATSVLYNITPTTFTNTIDTEINSLVPYCIPGDINVKVKGYVGESETLNFTCNYETPIIDTLSIKNGKIGNKLTINGKHLLDAMVTFNFYDTEGKIYMNPEINTDFSITVTVPKGESGIKTNINVKTKGGISNSLSFTYDYLQPVIKNTTVLNNTLVITGNNFLGTTNIQCISSFPKLNMEFALDANTPNNKIIVYLYNLKGNIRLNILNSKTFPLLETTTNTITVP